MRIFNRILMVAVATVSVPVTTAQAETYLGNRDDIVVMQPRRTAGKALKKIETVKEDASMMLQSAAKMAEPVTQKIEPVKTIQMSSEVSRQSSSVPSSVAPAAGSSYSSASSVAVMPSGMSRDVPPNARPGECYAKVLIPARFETESKRIKVADEQRVLSRIVPAKYETTTERIKIKEATKYWKAGHGPITKKNDVTGEILCLVEEPAEYKTIEKRVLVQPEKPEYKTMPAEYETVTKKTMVQAENWEWRRILCETNLTSGSVKQIQTALNSKGYGVKVDGRLGDGTLGAINRYQLKHGLASRGITYETLSHLGISLTGV